MTCPRCAQPDVTSEACPRCGVILAKVRERKARAEPTPSPADEETEPGALGQALDSLSDIAAFALKSPAGVGMVLTLLAVVAMIWFPSTRPSPAAPPVPSPPGWAWEVAPAADIPPPSLAAFEPPPLPVDPAPVADTGLPEADRTLVNSLALKLGSPGSITEADLKAAEGLLAAHPEERVLRDLLERLLITAAWEDNRLRQYTRAAARLERATLVQPTGERAWLALLQVHLATGNWSAAEAAARGALVVAPRSAEAWRGLGYALLRQDRNREAAEALRTALEIRRDGETQALLDRVEKALADEQGMTERHLSHFNVRYDGDAHEDVGREILRALERHFATLASTLDHQPAATIPVILFSREAYYNASGAPAWSGGVYDSLDGRIRIPIGGLSSTLSPDMDGTLIHELTHAFVADRTKGVAPREVHEGLAQYMEGRRVASELTSSQLTALADGRVQGVMGFYFSALSFVEYLVGNRGMGGMNELLETMGRTGRVDEAFRQVHGGGFRATQQAWSDQLRRQHGS